MNGDSDQVKWVTVAGTSELPAGEAMGVSVEGRRVALYNVDGSYYATADLCTHGDALLSGGWLDGDEIECPLHGGRFSVKTGKGLGPPIPCDVKIYPTRVSGDKVEVGLPKE